MWVYVSIINGYNIVFKHGLVKLFQTAPVSAKAGSRLKKSYLHAKGIPPVQVLYLQHNISLATDL
ncbi:hypothetical protein A0256_21905 [Mucilaginibacter sp. PAMC 26640]|nr:hypothetical protein A0256_21905 [Mucilaginibacter sp. PAMC 26640]